MASIYDVNPNQLIEKVAQELKNNDKINPPEWAAYAKTGVHKQRSPMDPNWWYLRCAAVLRKINMLGPIGVSKLKALYGGKKNRGVKPGKFKKGSGNVARKVLQQLEAAGLAKQDQKGSHKGRVITPAGKSVLDKAATALQKNG